MQLSAAPAHTGRCAALALVAFLALAGIGFGQGAPPAPSPVADAPKPAESVAAIAPYKPALSSTPAPGGEEQEEPNKEAEASPAARGKPTNWQFDPELYDSLHQDNSSALSSLFDSIHPETSKGKKWYEKFKFRGYTQIRFGRTVSQDQQGGQPSLLGDHSINGKAENFSIRRSRLVLSGDVSERLFFFFQADFANNPGDGTATYFGQLRDAYADVYLDLEKVNRIRIGQSKIPWGFEEMQSSGNRVPIDRSDAIDSGDSPNQRDLGVFYYWTPVEKQKLLAALSSGGLKGTGNYGIFAFGVYNGQGSSQVEQNLNLHMLSRLTWPVKLPSGQVFETSIQAYTGQKVVAGEEIRALGQGDPLIPAGTRGNKGLLEQRVAGSFIWYPQPWGFQTEWNVGRGPGLNYAQTALEVRNLWGGYAMLMYKLDTVTNGVFIPYTRYQHYRGGYRSVANAPYGTHDEVDLGVEWQVRRDLEIVLEYNFVDGVSLEPVNTLGVMPYKNFRGGVIRCQVQVNY